MKLNEMQTAWRTRGENFVAWNNKLFTAANQLRDDLRVALDPIPATYRSPHSGATFNYVDAYDGDGSKTLLSRTSACTKAFLDEGYLRFALGVTLDENGPTSWPKMVALMPVAVRMRDHRVQYTFWDTSVEERKQVWTNDLTVVTGLVIARLSAVLESNPMVGPEDKTSIGFI